MVKNIFMQGLLMVLWSPIAFATLTSTQGINEMDGKSQISATPLNFNDIEFWQGDETNDYETVLAKLITADVVIVGEYHDQWASHLLQERLLKDLSLQGKWAVGAEWLPLTTQTAVDGFLQGELSSFDFLRESGYVNHWGVDYRLLKPIFDYAQTAKLPFIALNAPRKVTQKISKQGLDVLTASEKKMFPIPLYSMSEKYEKFARAFFESNHLPPDRIERMLMIQSVWDQTMANSVAKFLSGHPGHKMIVFAGMVHSGKGAGIEDALRQMLPNKKIVTLGNGRFDDFEEGGFDYFAELPQLEMPDLPSLGVLLEDGSGDLLVEAVLPDSVASQIGLKAGDEISKIGAFVLHDFSDLKAAMWLLDVSHPVIIKWHSKDELLDIPFSNQAQIDFESLGLVDP